MVRDVDKAIHYLGLIGYYRLIEYARHFRASPQRPERYIGGTTFEDVLDLYVFDRKIRMLLFDAIERVEVAVRATINHTGSLNGGPFWLTDANNFDLNCHRVILEQVNSALGDDRERHPHTFIAHFHKKYIDPYPPGWMLMECLPMGALSKIYKHMRGRLRVPVAHRFSLQHDVLESWLHSISHTRNICAHHSGCWKRTYTIQPKIPRIYRGDIPATSAVKLYMQCWMLNHIMHIIADDSKWHDRLKSLIDERPKTTLGDMGFPDGWHEHKFWSL